MRKLLLLAVSVSLVFTASTMARGNHNNAVQNNQYNEQYGAAENDATDWDDHTVPDPQYDSQAASLAMCGKHTVFINQDDNILTVDGITYKLVGSDYRQTDTDVALIDHYTVTGKPSDTIASLMVFQKTKEVLFYLKGDSGSVQCKPYNWN